MIGHMKMVYSSHFTDKCREIGPFVSESPGVVRVSENKSGVNRGTWTDLLSGFTARSSPVVVSLHLNLAPIAG